jgi:signal transduction histidine kinase
LQVLIGYLDILRDEWAEKFDPEPRTMLERMNSNLHDLTQSVDNIMEFVMWEAGATGRVEEDVSISNLVSDLAPAIEAARGGKDLALKIDIEHAPQMIHTSRRPLRSILSNLVLNAIKFTERGSVTVRISSSRARGAEPGLVLEVADTGLGMSAALIQASGRAVCPALAVERAQVPRTRPGTRRGTSSRLGAGRQTRSQFDAGPRLALRGADSADTFGG